MIAHRSNDDIRGFRRGYADDEAYTEGDVCGQHDNWSISPPSDLDQNNNGHTQVLLMFLSLMRWGRDVLAYFSGSSSSGRHRKAQRQKQFLYGHLNCKN